MSNPSQSELNAFVAKVAAELGDKATKRAVRERCEEHFKRSFLQSEELAAAISKLYVNSSSKPQKRTREAATKSADQPKGAVTAYIFFTTEKAPLLRAADPSKSQPQIMKEAAELWKNLGESEKAKYLNMAAEDKKRFDREVEAFKAKGGVMVRGSKKEAKVKKAKKDPNAPKRAKNAYMFFATEFRTKHPELSMIEQTKAAGEAWRNLADDAKKPYEAMAAKDRERYENEKSA